MVLLTYITVYLLVNAFDNFCLAFHHHNVDTSETTSLIFCSKKLSAPCSYPERINNGYYH